MLCFVVLTLLGHISVETESGKGERSAIKGFLGSLCGAVIRYKTKCRSCGACQASPQAQVLCDRQDFQLTLPPPSFPLCCRRASWQRLATETSARQWLWSTCLPRWLTERFLLCWAFSCWQAPSLTSSWGEILCMCVSTFVEQWSVQCRKPICYFKTKHR